MPTWIRETTRWACYLRDDLRCVWCQAHATDMLLDDGNFLTLDHFRHRRHGGGHEPSNLVTACYRCNRDRGVKVLRVWCAERGWNFGTVRSRALLARQRNVESYREAARAILGEIPGLPRADLVTLMAWRARQQWAGEHEHHDWEGAEMCPTCRHVAHVDLVDVVPF